MACKGAEAPGGGDPSCEEVSGSSEGLGLVQEEDAGGFFLTGLDIGDEGSGRHREASRRHGEHAAEEDLSASSKLCEKMHQIVLLREVQAS